MIPFAASAGPQNISDTHDLLSLWHDFYRINEACGAKADDEALMAVEKVIVRIPSASFNDRHLLAGT
jgi:hypothetical protein